MTDDPSPKRAASPQKTMYDGDQEDAPAPKRARTINTEERARSKRMFGSLLGTLRRFQDDDKSKRSSQAARRREETSQRIAARLASETNLIHNISATERELRTVKIADENAAYVLEHRQVALTARHTSLRVSGRYLHTSVPSVDPVFDSVLFARAPVPVARGPSKTAGAVPPLFFLPKILLPEQEETLRAQEREVERVIDEESDALREDKAAQAETAAQNADKIADLTAKLQHLKEQQAAVVRGEARGEVRAEARGEARGEARDEARGEARDEARGEARGEVRGEARGESRDEARGESRDEAPGETHGGSSVRGSEGASVAAPPADRESPQPESPPRSADRGRLADGDEDMEVEY